MLYISELKAQKLTIQLEFKYKWIGPNYNLNRIQGHSSNIISKRGKNVSFLF